AVLFVGTPGSTLPGAGGTPAGGSAIGSSPTTYDATYGSIDWRVSKPGDSTTSLVSRGVVLRGDNGTTCGAFVRSPANARASELTLYNNSGTITVLVDGNTGTIRGAGFQVGGSPGFDGQIPAGRPINVIKGIV